MKTTVMHKINIPFQYKWVFTVEKVGRSVKQNDINLAILISDLATPPSYSVLKETKAKLGESIYVQGPKPSTMRHRMFGKLSPFFAPPPFVPLWGAKKGKWMVYDVYTHT